jgi:GNAT superfamily N-acetyltransferase
MSIAAGFALRAADASETEALYKLRARSFEATYGSAISPDVLDTLMWGYSPAEFAQAVGDKQIFVIDIRGSIAGFVWIEATHGKELVVNPEHYGSGVARALLIEGIRVLLERTTGDIQIYATPTTMNWYKRFSFKPVELVTVRHQRLGTRIPLERMILKRDDAVFLTTRRRRSSSCPASAT